MRREQPSHAPEHHYLAVIERVTGHRPPTCPWRAMYDPLVREVMKYSWAIENGNLPALIDGSTPAILVEAIGVYRMALLSTSAEERRLREEARPKR